MYKSPIELITTDIQTQIVQHQEEHIFQAVTKIFPNIDKDELTKALAYDRDQYEQGYRDAMKKMQWIPVTEGLPEPYVRVLTYKQSLGSSRSIMRIDQTILLPDGTLAWTDDFETWKSVVAHWMPLPEPPKGE